MRSPLLNPTCLYVCSCAPLNLQLDKAVEACGMYYALFWWIVFLQLFTLIGMILLGFGKLASFKGVVAAFCYIVTPLMCYMAHDQVYTAYRLKDADSDWWVRNLRNGMAFERHLKLHGP